MKDTALAEELLQQLNSHRSELSFLWDKTPVQGEDGVLICLYDQDGPMLSGEIMEQMALTTGRVANILKRLEEKDLVRRSIDSMDRRRVYVSLTDAGFRRGKELHTQSVERLRRLLEYMGERDSQEYVRLLQRFFRALEATAGQE